jgi:hypothetical protein
MTSVAAAVSRKHLSADALYGLLREAFARLPDPRKPGSATPLDDIVMAAFAMFAIKDPSLLAFQERRRDANLKNLFHIGTIPSDTHMREVLDLVDPDILHFVFADVFRQVQRGKLLKRFVFHKGCYLVSIDGSGYFSSDKIHCPGCLIRQHRDGTVAYQHQMLTAVIVHPDHKEVIPLGCEPIQNGDGSDKNDCERNAARRLLAKIRAEHPHLKLIVIEDGLASNGPHLRDLKQHRMHFLLGAKPGDHANLFEQVEQARREGRVRTRSGTEGDHACQTAWVGGLALNASNEDLEVDFLEYTEQDKEGGVVGHFAWVTDLGPTGDTAGRFVRGGRARWKIENETFNTLKNQGYHFEHNFGHGQVHLSVVLAMLMLLAFLVDQVQQISNPAFQAAWQKAGSKRALWERVRSHFYHFLIFTMQELYEAISTDRCRELPLPRPDTS